MRCSTIQSLAKCLATACRTRWRVLGGVWMNGATGQVLVGHKVPAVGLLVQILKKHFRGELVPASVPVCIPKQIKILFLLFVSEAIQQIEIGKVLRIEEILQSLLRQIEIVIVTSQIKPCGQSAELSWADLHLIWIYGNHEPDVACSQQFVHFGNAPKNAVDIWAELLVRGARVEKFELRLLNSVEGILRQVMLRRRLSGGPRP